MAFRYLARSVTRFVQTPTISTRLFSAVTHGPKIYQARPIVPVYGTIRSLSSTQSNLDAYRDLETFLQKEIQSEKNLQKHPSKLPTISNFQVTTDGPEVTLTREKGNAKITVTLNVTNTVNPDETEEQMEMSATSKSEQDTPALKSRPAFTVDINRGGQTLSFVCSFLPNEYPDAREAEGGQSQDAASGELTEDFQIDEFTIHDGEWHEKVYSTDCSIVDGELYDKLLNLLEDYGIGEEFANQLADFCTAYEHRQYIGLLEKLQQFVKK